jgi:hypothetical protein
MFFSRDDRKSRLKLVVDEQAALFIGFNADQFEGAGGVTGEAFAICQGRGGSTSQDDGGLVDEQLVGQSLSQEFKIEGASSLNHQAADAELVENVEGGRQVNAAIAQDEDFCPMSAQHFHLFFRGLCGGKYYYPRRPSVEKIPVGIESGTADNTCFDGIGRQAALLPLSLERFSLDGQAGVFAEQRFPADHDGIGVGTQPQDAFFICRGGDGRSFALEGVHFAIGRNSNVDENMGTVHREYQVKDGEDEGGKSGLYHCKFWVSFSYLVVLPNSATIDDN